MMSPSSKRVSCFGCGLVLAAVIFAGCKSSPRSEPKPAPVPQPQPTVQTNAPQVAVRPPAPPSDSGDSMKPGILEWDAVTKEYQAKAGETNAPFTFSLTNVSTGTVMIYDTSTSCDCTVASLPSKPWTLAPGASGQIHAAINLHGKSGPVTNSIIVFTSKGNRRLNVKAVAP